MPRRFIKRFMPDPEFIRNHRSLQVLSRWLHEPNLWHLNRYSVSMAFLLGLFAAFVPLPSQMLIAAVLAVWLRANLPISVALVWISNPLTMPPIFYVTYKVGAWVLRLPPREVRFEPSVEWLSGQLSHVWQPFLCGSLIVGLGSGLLAAGLVQVIWRLHVRLRWRARLRRRRPD